MASLEIRSANAKPRRENLKGSETTVGRRHDCDLVLRNETISRRHAKILSEDGIYYVEDLASARGTLLNDVKLETRQALRDGDRIGIADTVIVFHAGSILPDDPTNKILSSREGLPPMDATGAAEPREKLRALLELTASLGVTLDLDELFPKILESAFRIFPQSSRGAIWLLEPNGELFPRAARNRHGTDCETLPLSQTIAERVVQRGEAVLSADTGSDERFDASASVVVHGIRSVMCAPLLSSSREAAGMLQLDSNSIVQSFTDEDLDVLVNVANLAGHAVEHAQLHASRLDYERRERDLSLARTVQAHFLPENPPSIPGYRLAHHYQPAESVGGDYFDYVELSDGRLAVALGDVAGKGVSAALLMARLCSDTRALLLSTPDPVAAVTALNRRIAQHAIFGRFVTMLMCVLDPSSGEVAVVNAGHLPPLKRNSDGEIVELGDVDAGPPLGVLPDAEYAETRVHLDAGDALLFFTDGVSEARSPSGEMFGDDAIPQAMADSGNADEIVATLLERVEAHTSTAPANDDLCTIAISRDLTPS